MAKAVQRLRDPRDFDRVYSVRKVIHARNLVLFFRPNGLPFARLGVSVGTKHGNAVRRNRIKRVFRAAFRECRDALPPACDYVLVPKRGVTEYTTAAVSETLRSIAKRVTA